jgi:hypothetical protein
VAATGESTVTEVPPSGPDRFLARLRSVETSTYLIGAGLVIAFMAGWLANSAIGGDGSPVVVVSSPSLAPTSGPAPTTDAAVTSEPAVSDPAAEQTTDPSDAVPAPPELPADTVPAAPIAKFSCPAATVTVGDAGQLTDALRKAGPGTVIRLKDGVYQGDGEFTASAKGTASEPIYLCGGRAAILQGQGFKADYVLHFENAANWRVDGFTVRFGQKGVMVDTGTGIALQNLLVADIGDEAVHLRHNSTDDVVRGLTIRNTGNRRDKFGEGVYVGTAVSNWPTITGGQPDHSDRNFVLDNVISQTTSESVDIKEGTTGGVVAGNTFDGAKLSGADSWVDVKGNGWLIAGNRGRTSPKDGFQTHVILKGWGDANLFTDNVADLAGGSGVGFYLHEQLTNKVSCNNKVTGAEGGLSNYPCSD